MWSLDVGRSEEMRVVLLMDVDLQGSWTLKKPQLQCRQRSRDGQRPQEDPPARPDFRGLMTPLLRPFLLIPPIRIRLTTSFLFLGHSVYSVIPPEGCAAILWNDRARAPEAAEALRVTARNAHELGRFPIMPRGQCGLFLGV